MRVRHADVEADHGVVGHDVQGAAAGDLSDIDGDALALAVEGVQAGGDDGGAGDGVGALVEGAARVGGLAGDDQMVVAAALALARERAVGQGGLIGHADMAARAELGQQGGGGGRADLLVRREQDGPADTLAVGMGLERLKRRQQDGDATLHIGDTGTVQGAVGAGDDGLEARGLGEDGVVVAGQDDLQRGVGAAGDLEGVGVRLLTHRAVVGHGGGAPGGNALDGRGQGARLGLEQGEDGVQSGGVTAAGIDVRPRHRASDDDGFAGRDVIEHGLVRRQNPHRRDPRRARGKGEARPGYDSSRDRVRLRLQPGGRFHD